MQNSGGSELHWKAAISVSDTVPPNNAFSFPVSGGPDAFGYTWRDSRSTGGPVFSWVDISTTGTTLFNLIDDEVRSGIPLGFDFPFYGMHFNSVNISMNGFLSFTNSNRLFFNTTLPDPNAPENLIAPFWDDFFIYVGNVKYRNDSGRFIVTYDRVIPFGTGGPGGQTFQVILHADGRIVYQYLSIGGGSWTGGASASRTGPKTKGLPLHSTPATSPTTWRSRLRLLLRGSPYPNGPAPWGPAKRRRSRWNTALRGFL